MSRLRYLLDTNIVILAVERLETNVLARLAHKDPEMLAISTVSYAELLRGFGSGFPEGYDMFLSQIAILPFDELCAKAYASLPFKRHAFDRLIGAHAKSVDATMVTANLADFDDIPGLKIEDWTR